MHSFERRRHDGKGAKGRGEGGVPARSAKGETARYFRAMHFFTESRVHAADMVTDAENAGAPS